MSREACGVHGCPGWYGKGQLRDVRGMPGPEDNAIGAPEGQGRSSKLYGEGAERKPQETLRESPIQSRAALHQSPKETPSGGPHAPKRRVKA